MCRLAASHCLSTTVTSRLETKYLPFRLRRHPSFVLASFNGFWTAVCIYLLGVLCFQGLLPTLCSLRPLLPLPPLRTLRPLCRPRRLRPLRPRPLRPRPRRPRTVSRQKRTMKVEEAPSLPYVHIASALFSMLNCDSPSGRNGLNIGRIAAESVIKPVRRVDKGLNCVTHVIHTVIETVELGEQ